MRVDEYDRRALEALLHDFTLMDLAAKSSTVASRLTGEEIERLIQMHGDFTEVVAEVVVDWKDWEELVEPILCELDQDDISTFDCIRDQIETDAWEERYDE